MSAQPGPSSTPVPAAPRAKSRKHLSYVHSFRAFAIVIIVAGHMLQAFDWSARPALQGFLLDLIENGTVLFVFVAGFLFQHLSENFRYGDYLQKKALNVLLPYVIVSAPAVIEAVFVHDPTRFYPQLAGHSQAWQAAWFYLEGGAHSNFPLWFVPMITLHYLAAPVFLLVDRHPRLYGLLWVLLPLSALAHRPGFPNLQTFQLAAYFVPAYLLGMWTSANRDAVETWLRRYAAALGALFLAMLAAQTLFATHHGNYEGAHLFSQEYGPIDWLFPQKVILCFALLGFALRQEKRLERPLRFLGEASFTIFFLHGYLLAVCRHLAHGQEPAGGVLPWIALTAGAIAVCLAIAAAARKLLGSRSRYVVGC